MHQNDSGGCAGSSREQGWSGLGQGPAAKDWGRNPQGAVEELGGTPTRLLSPGIFYPRCQPHTSVTGLRAGQTRGTHTHTPTHTPPPSARAQRTEAQAGWAGYGRGHALGQAAPGLCLQDGMHGLVRLLPGTASGTFQKGPRSGQEGARTTACHGERVCVGCPSPQRCWPEAVHSQSGSAGGGLAPGKGTKCAQSRFLLRP